MIAALPASCATPPAGAAKDQRCAFIGITDFSSFTKSPGASNNETAFLSREISAPIDWNELVVSWNVPSGVHLKAEARAVYADHATQFYTMGLWSDDPARFPRESVRRQRDTDGTLLQDTLVLSKPARTVQLRITAGGPAGQPLLKFLGLSFCNTNAPAAPSAPNRAAWGKILEVPERRQAEYEGGGGWCSPTSLSVVLAYWAERLHRPELNHTVPDTAHAIADGPRGDTGNWPFNTAYAGHYPGMRAYVTRLGGVTELEDWIAAGIPVVISVSSYLANNRTNGPDAGHLIVCVGFTDTGDVVANDPGVSVRRNVRARRVFAREKVVNAWKKSKNAVYLIYPETAKVPADGLGHWDRQS
jgi:Peptidase_C39 like family